MGGVESKPIKNNGASFVSHPTALAFKGNSSASQEGDGGEAAKPVQRYTNNSSTAGQGHKKSALTRAQLEEMTRLQKRGYALVGKLTRVKECGTIPVVNGRVGLGITDSGGLQCSGLSRCASRWCPDCWGKVAAHRTEEITRVATWVKNSGYQLVLMTFTAAHVQNSVLAAAGGNLHEALKQQDVTDLFTALGSAWSAMHVGRGGMELKTGRIGYVRAFELTCDGLSTARPSGVHGHFHVLLVLDGDVDLLALKKTYWDRWQTYAAKADLTVSSEGFDFKNLDLADADAVQAAASYLVKGEKRDARKIGLEMTRSEVKGGEKRTSPEGFLRAVSLLGEDTPRSVWARAMAQWRAIEEACRGRRWLTWSRDLRNLADLGADLSDEEIALAEHETEQVVLVRWQEIRDHLDEMRQIIRESRTSKQWETLLLLLDSLGVDYEVTDWETWGEIMSEHQREKWRKK